MSKTLAYTAARIAALALRKDSTAQHQCFRIKNLHPEEVVQFVDCWTSIATDSGLSSVKLVVADSLGGRIAPSCVAEPGYSITHYRNHNRNGLVYVETSVQSDEQGLQNIFSLRDSNFLDGSFDAYMPPGSRVQDLLVSIAWSGAGGSGDIPALLAKRLLKVIDLVHPAIEPVPVRRFVTFAETAAKQWLSIPGVVDAPQADALVGRCLVEMDMFPDEGWADVGNDARLKRRLETNARHADMLDGTSELDADDIGKLAEQARWRAKDGSELPADEAGHWKTLCVEYARTRTAAVRRQIPYEIFAQLFAKDTAGLKLGEKIRAEIERNAPDRIGELEALDVLSGLNTKNSAEAARLLGAEPPAGLAPLTTLLSPATRKSLERLAEPPRRRFFNPAIELVRMTQKVSSATGDNRIATVRVEAASTVTAGSLTRGLFAFLYGDSLSTLAVRLEGLPGTCSIQIAEELVEQMAVPPLRDDAEAVDAAASQSDDSEDTSYNWDPLGIRFSFLDAKGRIVDVSPQMEWLPPSVLPLAFFWFLCCAPESDYLARIGSSAMDVQDEGDQGLRNFVNRERSLATLRLGPSGDEVPDALTRELIEARQRFRDGLLMSGLGVELIRSFLDEWNALLLRAREDYVPDGLRPLALDLFLATDLLEFPGSERRLMSPAHPIRLRWIGEYLERSIQLAQDVLSGVAAFADADGDYYLNWLEDLTPRESPPLCVGTQGTVLYSRSESGWWEDFSPLAGGSGDLSFDDHSLASVADRVISYLDAHPYKRDGLSMLIVMPTSDAMPADLLRKISTRANRDMRVSLHVAAPRARWEAIAREVEKLVEQSDGSSRTGLFPDKDLSLLDMSGPGNLPEELSRLQLDIAIVTHVLQEQINPQHNTEVVVERAGRFDPLLQRPLRLESGSGGGAVSMVLLPKYSDPMLASWSTLVVRAHRGRPVAPGQPENVDLVELRVNFQDSAQLFRQLHERCHWVITLERHISRQQIESAEAGAPDVLSIEDGVGANRLNTLVVSSSSGRALIQSRLARKLKRLVPQLSQDSTALTSLAHGVYESIRKLAPRLALQALGVSRVTEEIVGVSVARNVADEVHPSRLRKGLSAWLSLDERPDWFGGAGNIRADMCRIVLDEAEDGVIEVDILVLEGKLRQGVDPHGLVQVQRSLEFFGSVLGHQAGSDVRQVDAQMWLEQIAAAIETVAPEAVHHVLANEPSVDLLVERVLSRFRDGAIRVRSLRGLYCACLWTESFPELQRLEQDGVTVVRASVEQLRTYLQARPRRVQELPREDIADPAPPVDASVHVLPEPVDGSSDGSNDEVEPIDDQRSTEPEPAVSSGIASRGLPQAALQEMYGKVLACFDQHGIRVSAAPENDQPIIEGPASILFKVRPATGVDPRKPSEKASALKLALELDAEQNVNFSIDRGYVTIDVPKRPEQRYYVDAAETWTRWTRKPASLSVPIGEDRFGDLVELDFSSPNTPHLLVAGTTGSGKSEALNTILYGLTRHFGPEELRLMLVDPKGTELNAFEDSPFLEGSIGWDDADAIELLKRAVEEMQRRYQLFKGVGKRSLAEFNASVSEGERLPWWLVVLDEYADLTHDPQAKKDIEAELKRLAQKARSSGIHIIVATQKPSAEVISTNLRSNLPAQLVLRVKSATESRVVIDEAGGETLNGRGDALLKADGKLRRVQCSRALLD